MDETFCERDELSTSPSMVASGQSVEDRLKELLGTTNSEGTYSVDQRTARRLSALYREALRAATSRESRDHGSALAGPTTPPPLLPPVDVSTLPGYARKSTVDLDRAARSAQSVMAELRNQVEQARVTHDDTAASSKKAEKMAKNNVHGRAKSKATSSRVERENLAESLAKESDDEDEASDDESPGDDDSDDSSDADSADSAASDTLRTVKGGRKAVKPIRSLPTATITPMVTKMEPGTLQTWRAWHMGTVFGKAEMPRECVDDPKCDEKAYAVLYVNSARLRAEDKYTWPRRCVHACLRIRLMCKDSWIRCSMRTGHGTANSGSYHHRQNALTCYGVA